MRQATYRQATHGLPPRKGKKNHQGTDERGQDQRLHYRKRRIEETYLPIAMVRERRVRRIGRNVYRIARNTSALHQRKQTERRINNSLLRGKQYLSDKKTMKHGK